MEIVYKPNYILDVYDYTDGYLSGINVRVVDINKNEVRSIGIFDYKDEFFLDEAIDILKIAYPNSLLFTTYDKWNEKEKKLFMRVIDCKEFSEVVKKFTKLKSNEVC